MRILNKVKKCIPVVLALALALCMSGAAYAYTEGFFEYAIEDQSVTITGYFGSETEVTVPQQIAGYPVSKIASGAFADTSISVLHLPDTIMEIEAEAIGANISVDYANRPAAAETPTETSVSEAAPANGTTEVSGQEAAAVSNTGASPAAAGSTTAADPGISESSDAVAVLETDDTLSEADVEAAEAKEAEDAKTAEAMEKQPAEDTASAEAEAPAAVKSVHSLLWTVPVAIVLICGIGFLCSRKKTKDQ